MMDNDDDYPETLLVCLDLLISEACLQKWKLVDGFWMLSLMTGF